MKEKKVKKLNKEVTPLPDIPEGDEVIESSPQTLNQRKIALVQSIHGPMVVELVRDVLQQVPLIGKDQWETVKNAIIIDTSSTVLRDLVEHMEEIKKGKLVGK